MKKIILLLILSFLFSFYGYLFAESRRNKVSSTRQYSVVNETDTEFFAGPRYHPAQTSSFVPWWRQKGLEELFQYEVEAADILGILRNPAQYEGKKIRIVGEIKTGFEYADIFDKEGKRLGIWPDESLELLQLLKDTGIGSEIDKSKYQEFVGYLEFEGNYGHLGSWPFQLFIVEVYPYTVDGRQRETYRDIYKKYLDSLAKDKTEIRNVFRQWIFAMQTKDVNKYRDVLHKNSQRYRLTRDEEIEAGLRQTNMSDITIINVEKMPIFVEGQSARADVDDTVVTPFYRNDTGKMIKLMGEIDKVRSYKCQIETVIFKRDGDSWKIFDYFLPCIPLSENPH